MANLNLNIYKKEDPKTIIATGTDTDSKALINGLTAGTVVADGDYTCNHTDPEGKLTPSDMVDVPGFTVEAEKQQAPAPENVKVTTTNDGAEISAE